MMHVAMIDFLFILECTSDIPEAQLGQLCGKGSLIIKRTSHEIEHPRMLQKQYSAYIVDCT
jgi:hypothetical protein